MRGSHFSPSTPHSHVPAQPFYLSLSLCSLFPSPGTPFCSSNELYPVPSPVSPEPLAKPASLRAKLHPPSSACRNPSLPCNESSSNHRGRVAGQEGRAGGVWPALLPRSSWASSSPPARYLLVLPHYCQVPVCCPHHTPSCPPPHSHFISSHTF